MASIKNFLIGIVIGISNVIPGVSGGTMAIVFGIYDRLISSVINFFEDWKKNIIFLGALALGMGSGILLFAKLIKFCLENYPQQTNFFFIGLIIGTVPLIYKKSTELKVNKLNIVWCIVAFAIAFLMGWIGKPETAQNTLITTLSITNGLKIFLGGFVAAAAMILPGISGSFILLLFGLYDSIITAVTEFNIPILFVVAIGIMFGFLIMTKIIDVLFKKYPQTAYFIILGLIVGSVYSIFPGIDFSLDTLVSLITFAIGFTIAYGLGKTETSQQ